MPKVGRWRAEEMPRLPEAATWEERLALYTTYGPEDEDVVAHATADLKISFLDSMQGDELLAEGRIIRKARMAAFGTSGIRDSKGTLIAVGRATFLIRREPQGAAG